MFLNHKQFMSALNISEIFREFLIKSTAKFTKQQRQLVLNIDEVYVQSDFSYKGGKIFGSSSSNVEVAAKTVLAFMVTSLFEKWSEIVRLYPLASTDAKVFEMVTTVIARVAVGMGIPMGWEWERFFPCGDPHRNPHGIFEYGFIRSSLINIGFTIDTNLL